MKKTQKQNVSQQQDSSGSIPSIEITKENVESGDYISDESEYTEGNGAPPIGRRNTIANISNNNSPQSPLTSYTHQQHHQPQQQQQQHQHHHQSQVRWKIHVLPERVFLVK